MRIAIDAMGGDYAPREIVRGSVDALGLYKGIDRLYLVGDEAAIKAELDKCGKIPSQIEILHTTEVVEMHESPVLAIRRKKDSSIGRAVELVKNGEADAVFSAGNTGAAVAATTLKLRTLEGIQRPAIATVFPTQFNPCVLIDAGGNTDCTPLMLSQFALMGNVYSQDVLGVENPRIGLLNIGGEEKKGNETTKEAFRLLDESPLNFIGNVESQDLFGGRVDVVACDGFVGNVVLKTAESVSRAAGSWFKTELTKNPLRLMGALLLRGGLKDMKLKMDPQNYGGAPLLGVNGICIIGHGSSSALSVRNAIRVLVDAVDHKINHAIKEGIQKAHLIKEEQEPGAS